MSPPYSVAALWFASCTAAAVFHHRGSANDIAPYSNVTVPISLSSVATSPNVPPVSSSSRPSFSVDIESLVPSRNGNAHPTGVGPTGSPDPITKFNTTQPTSNVTINPTSLESDLWSNATNLEPTRISNATCTINIPSASIDYWYPATYSHAVGTMTTQYGNFSQSIFYTLMPPTATFDVASALVSDFACTMSESPLPDTDWTYTFCLDYSDKPTAASTSLVYRTAAVPFPPGGVIPMYDAGLYDIYIDLPLATRTLSVAPNITKEQVSATPFVYFTAYEVETGNKTETVLLPSTQAYPYWAKDIQHEAAASGSLPAGFMQQISQTDCDPGELHAVVEVLIVVDLYYVNLPMWDPMLIHFESTALGFDDPPVNINDDDGTTRGVPLTMDDWDLPGDSAKATPMVMISPNNRPSAGPVPTTVAGGNSNNNDNTQQGSNSNGVQDSNAQHPTEVIVGSIGTLPVVVGPSSVVIVGSQTLRPGGPAIIVGGVTPVSLVPSATAIVVAGSTTLRLPEISNGPAQDAHPPPVLTIGLSTLTPNAATQFFVAPGQTLTPGGTVTIDGIVVSLAPSALFVVVGGSTQLLPPAVPGSGTVATSQPQIIIGGTTITALPVVPNNKNPNGVQNNAAPGPTFVVGGQTLAPGGQAITVSGTTLSLVPEGSSIVVNGVISAVANSPAQFTQPSITIGDSIFTAIPGPGNSFAMANQILVPGGRAITVSGTVVSLAALASFVVINGVTSTLANVAVAQVTALPVLTVGDSLFQPLPGTGTSYVIGSSILTPGGLITFAGTTISLAAGATAIVINGQTTSLSPTNQPIITHAPLLTVGSQTYTAVSGTTYIVNGQTLTPGGIMTVDGTTISLAPGATQLVYGISGRSTTTALFPATTTRSQSISGTTGATARFTGSDGQAIATSQRTGSASASRIINLLLSIVVPALSLLSLFAI